ncbi:MAG: methyltransferase domain-containing protein [Burkholderiales bacterium]
MCATVPRGGRPSRRFLPLLPCLFASLLLLAQDTGAERDAWQRPAEVMNALAVEPGSAVADVGCGEGYFSLHLAQRVGATGRVYAVDTDEEALGKLRAEAKKQKLAQIEIIVGADDDPRLPAGRLDAVLIVNAYHEMRRYDALLEAIHRALKPGGRLGIIDAATEAGQERNSYFDRHRVPAEVVQAEAERHGFRLAAERPGFTRPRDHRDFWFLVFEKPSGQ